MMRRHGIRYILHPAAWLMAVLLAVFVCGCSSVKHVPQGAKLLDNTRITVLPGDSTGRSPEGLQPGELTNYLRQHPNHKVLGFAKLQLGVYNLSGRDSSKRVNRWLRKLGQAPEIYDDELTQASVRQLRLAAVNKGYTHATVTADSVTDQSGRRMTVNYTVTPGQPHRLRSLSYDIADTAIAAIIARDTVLTTLGRGSLLDRNMLDTERALLTARLRNHGYYEFSKEYITFAADTAAGSADVDITLGIHPPRPVSGRLYSATDSLGDGLRHRPYRIGNVWFVTGGGECTDTVYCKGIGILYGCDRWLKPSSLEEQCFLRPGQLYRAEDVEMTYRALSRLGILHSISIDLRPQAADSGGTRLIDAYILLTRNKKQGLNFELEGTNSEGDLGFGVGVTYKYRNLGKASNLLTTKLRVSYESLSGNFAGIINNRYTEVAGEAGITFPKFVAPFLNRGFKQRNTATTELALSANYQERPEYTRIIGGAAYRYRWTTVDGTRRSTLDMVDVNYVRLPKSTIDFLNQIAPGNPLLRYSYEDHFIMRLGYTYYLTNKKSNAGQFRALRRQARVYTLRATAETAGNLLYGISHLVDQTRHDGVYKILGTQYSQYVRAEADYTYTRTYPGGRHSLAFHAGAGVGVPYGNSEMIPFEKRFYGGGANGVRGWSVRSLGPGSFDGSNSLSDFINQCGDIRLDLSLEYRAKLFWVFEGAVFVDAGNIWTIRSYPNQPGGLFKVRNLAKELAASYGVGLRLDFDYFLLRFDLGIKAHNPAAHAERWPIIHPEWRRDATFHFAVGYPF